MKGFTQNAKPSLPTDDEQQVSNDVFGDRLERDIEPSRNDWVPYNVSATDGSQHSDSDDDMLNIKESDQGNEFDPKMGDELEKDGSQWRLKKEQKPDDQTTSWPEISSNYTS